MIYYRKEFSIQASFGPTSPASYRDVMLHRKLVSEEVTVLDLWINHRGDSEGGLEGSVTLLSCTQSMSISGEYIKERIKKGGSHESWQPGERCAMGMAGLLGWRVIRKGAMTEKGKRRRHWEKMFYSSHLRLWIHYNRSLYKTFEIPLFKQYAESCQCLLRVKLWLPLQKATIGER